MSILPSADSARLIAELASDDALRRETAVARLSVIGARAVTRLLALAADDAAAVVARTAALRALEAIADPRSGVVAIRLSQHTDVRIATAATTVLGALSHGDHGGADRAFDRLAAMALDASLDSDRRVAACRALEGLPRNVVQPILDALKQSDAPAVEARATRAGAGATQPIDAFRDGDLPSDPSVLAAVVREEGAETPVTLLRQLVDRVRAKERAARGSGARDGWQAVRGLLHQHLAARGSRLAVYDLKETLSGMTGPLPVGFLAAAAAVGDADCLEPIAQAWLHAGDDAWWRAHLTEAFAAIVKREKVTRRHAAIKRLLERHPAAGQLAALAAKS